MSTLEEVNSEKMAALETLAQTNVDIGKAKAALATLKGDETNYLAQREAKAAEIVLKVIEESAKALSQAGGNYEELKKLQQLASSFAQYLIEAAAKFHKLYETFTENVEEWEKSVKKQEEEIAQIRKGLEEQAKAIEEDKKGIAAAKKQIEKDQIRINDDTERLARAVERLKNNRV